MDLKKSLTLLSILSLISLLLILISTFFIGITIFEIVLSTVVLSIFAARAHFRERVKAIYILSMTVQFIILIFLAMFIIMVPSLGIASIISLILMVYSASNRDKRKVIIAEILLLSTLVLISVLYIINFPVPME